MKKVTLLVLVSLLLTITMDAVAQKQRGTAPAAPSSETIQNMSTFERCGTMTALEARLKSDPEYRAQYEKSLREFQNTLPTSIQNTTALTGPVTIPVVVHIVLPNPNVVTDADVQYFIDRLNRDFSGFNPDSANGAPFFPVRGHSLLRFTSARRDPGGNLTNGIERRVGSGIITPTLQQAIKKTATGGLDPWDHTRYYNLWIGLGEDDLAGIAPEIGVGTAETDGVSIDYRVFANNSCYTVPEYALGRTAVHEIGHNFGLYHIFQGGCNDDDFIQLTTPGQQLPASLLEPSDDTPAQNSPTTNCPTGTVASGCTTSPNPPGRMYQNYMDYTRDGCYSMFTNGQVNRMHYVLENFRAGYLTTQGHIVPSGAITLDAMPFESVNPGGYELVGCTIFTFPANLGCAGSFIPKFRFRNNGLSVITSITVGYTLNNGATVTRTLTGLNLPAGGTLVVDFPAVNISDGPNVFRYFTSAPNGATDQNPTNDTLTVTLNISATPLPVFEGFESPVFPPNPWAAVSVNAIGTKDWVRVSPGRNSAFSLFINNYDNAVGAIDDFVSGSLATAPTDLVTVSFDVAHRPFSATASQDTLAVLISPDCGVTFTEVYKKWGITLATGPATTSGYIAPTAADWRTETINLSSALLASGKFQVIFRSKSRSGNNIFIDNILIQKKPDRDLRVVNVVSPLGNVCTNTVIPRVQVTNNGIETINSFQVTSTVGGVSSAPVTFATTLAPGASTTVTLPAVAVGMGVQNIVLTVTNVVFASGLGEQDLTNNSTTASFNVVTLRQTVSEGFETNPVGWTVSNPNGNNTWVITTPGSASARSAFINNYDNNVVGNIDDLRSPFVATAGYDSIFVTFDVAHKHVPGFADRLSVLAVTGCGTVFTPTSYSKAGAVLSTAGASETSYLTPGPNDWRNERIALGASVLGTSGNLLIAFRNTNDFGNNIFIDNVNIFPLFRRDLQVVAIVEPRDVICTGNFTPSVTIRNVGSDTITSYKVSYTIDNGPVQTTTVTGVSIPRNATVTISLAPATVGLGTHTITILAFDPVGRSGTGDNDTRNNTLTKTFTYTATVAAPLVEGFEGTQFPPPNWAVTNIDAGSTTWQRAPVGFNSTASAFINNFGYTGPLKRRDDLVTPTVTYSGVDSVNLMFDISAATRQYPGSALLDLDTLEVLVTRDCGITFTTVYKKWGAELQTVGDPNFPQDYLFTPNSPAQWRTESVGLTGFVNSPSLQVYFRNTTSKGNNIYLDNVRFTTKILPARLKEQGYLVSPTLFTSQFSIMFLQTPTMLRYVTVYNSGGQMVYKKEYKGDAQRLIGVNLSSQPAGTYIVNIGFEDEYRNVSERVIKR